MTKENQSDEHENVSRTRPRLIAFYLPQYHPIPENDEWWGKGFTEWTNVVKAKPLFKGHYQPHLPADLGFYDLRVPEVREQQAQLAREAGIEGFCYWHYWFAGKRLLERPFNEVLASGKPDFPFCLSWANESWKGIWHGADGRTLIEQTYPGVEDYISHFDEVLPAFLDPRYITIDEKPVFVLYQYALIPDLVDFIRLWRELALQSGLKGIYFLGMRSSDNLVQPSCLDGWIVDNFYFLMKKYKNQKRSPLRSLVSRLTNGKVKLDFSNLTHRPTTIPYCELASSDLLPLNIYLDEFPLVFPSWDNTPRSGHQGDVLRDALPDLFQAQLHAALEQLAHRPQEKQIVFIKSWNEWAEGNYLEPDQKYGRSYLNAIRDQLESMN